MIIDANAIIEWAGKLTVAGVLALNVVVLAVGIQRRWWVPGYIYERDVAERDARIVAITADRDKWQELALRGTDLVEAAVGGIRRATHPKAKDD